MALISPKAFRYANLTRMLKGIEAKMASTAPIPREERQRLAAQWNRLMARRYPGYTRTGNQPVP